MAEMTITLRIDPVTGKKNIIVALAEDMDSLPHEHEQMHRALVEKLLSGGLVKPQEIGQIVIEREEKGQGPALPGGTPNPEQRQEQAQGG